jgi:uncharacterized YigZ family protein
MSYFTLKNEGKGEFEEKKSVFIGHACRVYNEDEARKYINSIKGLYKDARHNVYAYVIGENLGIQRYSDDGEPQGTGGIPVLETIKKNGITDAVVVVTRYFGGILLGTGGLARAYGKGASLAIKSGDIVEKVKGRPVSISIEYDILGKLQYEFEQNEWFIDNIEYTDKVNLNTLCLLSYIDDMKNKILNITNGKCDIRIGDEAFYFREGSRLISI